MRILIFGTLSGVLALGFACNVHAKTPVHYAADQPVCPAEAAQAQEPETSEDTTAPADASAGGASPAPIKSGKSSRGKWKALLPGTIK